MARVKRGVTSHARHKKILKLAKGYRGRGSTNYRIALQKVEKALRYAYRDRRVRKRTFRSLWIQRINAAVRQESAKLTYARFMNGLK
ncbi:50S ribosomal protein L20, partial [Klebsiella pneumoniae]